MAEAVSKVAKVNSMAQTRQPAVEPPIAPLSNPEAKILALQHRRGCKVYDHRLPPCRLYDCRSDQRIWLDFDQMTLKSRFTRLTGFAFIALTEAIAAGIESKLILGGEHGKHRRSAAIEEQ